MREILAAQRNILLSPHSDDIAFSLGSVVTAARAGVMISLFTSGAYFAAEELPMWPAPARVARVSAVRRAEDEAFAASVGLVRFDLDLPEPALRGLAYNDPAAVADDAEALRGPLLARLNDLLVAAESVNLLCPAGIGGHANHLSTRTVVIEALPRLETRGARVMFYEDLPYASHWRTRLGGVANLKAALPGRRLVRRTARIDKARKLALINLYPSQLSAPPAGLSQYSPAAGWPPWKHEAVWELLPA